MIEVLNSYLEKIDILRKYTFSQYEVKCRDIGKFKVNAQLTYENTYLLNKNEQYYLLFDNSVIGVVKKVNKDSDGEYERTLVIEGSLSLVLFQQRVINGTINFSGYSYDYIAKLVEETITKDPASPRYINIETEFVDLNYMMFHRASMISKQVTGGYAWDEMSKVLEQDKLVLELLPNVQVKHQYDGHTTNISSWTFKIGAGKDRRKDNDFDNKAVVFSQSLSNITRTTYNKDSNSYRNVAYVAGEGENEDRKWYTLDINQDVEMQQKKGWGRSELWIDARDIQSENMDGEPITEEEYELLIKQRANEKAAENTLKDEYSATLSTRNSQYVFGVDYNIGDLVTVEDDELHIRVDAQVIGYTVSEQDNQRIVDIVVAYGAINREPVQVINKLRADTENNSNAIRYLENAVRNIDTSGSGGGGGDVGTLEKRVDELETNLNLVESSVSSLDNRIGTAEVNIKALQTKDADLESQIQAINQNTTLVQNKLTSLQTKVGELDTNIDSINSTVNSVTTKLGTVETSVSNLNKSVSMVQEDIENLYSADVTLNLNVSAAMTNASNAVNTANTANSNATQAINQVSSLQNQVNENTDDLSTLLTSYNQLNERVTNLENGGIGDVDFGRILKFQSGTKVVTDISGTSFVLFTQSEITSLMGSTCNGGNCAIFASNGDGDANGLHMQDVTYVPSKQQWRVTCDRTISGNVRCNYLIVKFIN